MRLRLLPSPLPLHSPSTSLPHLTPRSSSYPFTSNPLPTTILFYPSLLLTPQLYAPVTIPSHTPIFFLPFSPARSSPVIILIYPLPNASLSLTLHSSSPTSFPTPSLSYINTALRREINDSGVNTRGINFYNSTRILPYSAGTVKTGLLPSNTNNYRQQGKFMIVEHQLENV